MRPTILLERVVTVRDFTVPVTSAASSISAMVTAPTVTSRTVGGSGALAGWEASFPQEKSGRAIKLIRMARLNTGMAQNLARSRRPRLRSSRAWLTVAS